MIVSYRLLRNQISFDKCCESARDLLGPRCIFFWLTFPQTDEDVASLVSLQLRSFQSPAQGFDSSVNLVVHYHRLQHGRRVQY